MFFNLNNIVEKVKEKNRLLRITLLIISIFLLALNYNMYLKPNNLVTGGVSGLSIICQSIFSVDANIFVYIFSIILVIISFFTLGKSEASKHLFGSLLYPIMISFTSPLAELLNKYFVIEEFLLVIVITGLIMGFAGGIIFKIGYSSGGSDIVVQIMNKYAKIPIGQASFISNLVVILLGGAIFGINNVIYAIIIVYLNGSVVDKILLGISSSKQFLIHTKEINKVRELVIQKLGTGVTVLESRGGFTKRKSKMLMCVVANRDYYFFKEAVLEIDPNAFFVINDCYEVSGGVKRSNLPFI